MDHRRKINRAGTNKIAIHNKTTGPRPIKNILRRRNFFPQRKLYDRKNHAVFRGLPLGLQPIDLCACGRDLPLQFPHVAIGIGLLLQQFLQPPQCALRVA